MSWTKSSFCSHANCVEVGRADGLILMRDGKLGDTGRPLAFSAADWSGFLDAVPALTDELNGGVGGS